MGDALMALDDSANALVSYEADLAITHARATAEPRDPQWQRALALSHARIAAAQLSLDDAAAAARHLMAVADIRRHLATAAPRDATAQLEWAAANWQLASLPAAVCDQASRRTALQRGVATLRQLQGAGRLPASAKEWPAQFQAALKGVETTQP